ncbi:MAG: peptidylprolyl isomerase [Gammaproteobacteria bacterium]|nr:peptidylprolyl isomerase [Gammaproteobacteria bacterium]
MHMSHHSVLMTAAITGLLLAQIPAHAEPNPAGGASPRVIAVINGQNVTNADFGTFVSTRIGQSVLPANLNQQQLNTLQDEFINRELVYQDAVAKGLDKNPEVAIAIENQRHNIIAGYALRQIASVPPSDKALQDAYKTLASKPVKEYRASHIMVKTDADAQSLIDRLKKGEDFARLARENSLDPTAQNGGELGWLPADQIAQPIRDALGALKTGTFSTTPVQTQFGWHVLKLIETRILPPPDFDAVKDDLGRQLRNENIGKYIAQLRQHSKIDIKSDE